MRLRLLGISQPCLPNFLGNVKVSRVEQPGFDLHQSDGGTGGLYPGRTRGYRSPLFAILEIIVPICHAHGNLGRFS